MKTKPATTSHEETSKDRLRLWVRLLRAARVIEGELRLRLINQFNTTLPRFDVMAALYPDQTGANIRFSFSRFTTKEEVDRTVDILKRVLGVTAPKVATAKA